MLPPSFCLQSHAADPKLDRLRAGLGVPVALLLPASGARPTGGRSVCCETATLAAMWQIQADARLA